MQVPGETMAALRRNAYPRLLPAGSVHTRLLALWAPVALLGIMLIPATAATAPLHGTVVNCTTRTDCTFALHTGAGTGWANATGATLSFQLPGEALASYNLTYSTFIARLTGTYTYWTVGSFLGTDVNTGHVVYGTTNTNYTITCHGHSGRGGGCTYTYTTDNGTIVFKLTNKEPTATSVVCSPTTLYSGSRASCTVTVVDLWNASHLPTGKVHLATPGLGSFSSAGTCYLTRAGNCTLTWHAGDNTLGTVTLSATYYGNTTFYKSTGSATEDVLGG
jgi:hypothetical protein